MSKIRLIYILFAFIFSALVIRLFYWQVIMAKDLAKSAGIQYQSSKKIEAPRGNILASDGTWLAARGQAWRVFAWIPDIKDVNKTADSLAPFFAEEPSKPDLLNEANRIKELVGKKDVNWISIKTRVPKETKEKIEKMKLPGIGFEPEETRVYPEASMAANLLGFVGKDEAGESLGYFGLEGYYNLPLSGKPGFLEREKDATGTPIFPGSNLDISAVGGVDLLTHVDKGVQNNLDKKLKEGIEHYEAKGGSAVIMEPKTGAIIGASSFPSYDPAKYYDFGNEFFKNQLVSDSFEPGSIFKVVVMTAGLDAGVVKPDTKCDICSGPLKIDKYEIKTWNQEYHADSSMTDVIVNSDNVGMAYVAEKLGADRLYDYLERFGFGKKTGVDLQGEVDGNLRKKGTWNKVDLATTSFGQGIAVTPMQMIKAVGEIANGGYEVTPQVVDKLKGPNWQEDVKPIVGKKFISDEAVRGITAMMVQASEHGESKKFDIKGFKIAGKTGTAQIPIAGHYDEEKTNASFIGFAPADNPKFVMLVTLREPQTSQWASETAAPLWYNIASDLFLHYGIQPEN
jgi:cell division protein FtsI/penicillin-binding protein 2